MRAAAESTSSLGEELAGPTNVLLIAPPLGEEVGDACSSLLSVASPDGTNLLSVTFNQSPDARLERWRTTGGPTDPANLGFTVVVGRPLGPGRPAAGGGTGAGRPRTDHRDGLEPG